jgi:hypothetical protein
MPEYLKHSIQEAHSTWLIYICQRLTPQSTTCWQASICITGTLFLWAFMNWPPYSPSVSFHLYEGSNWLISHVPQVAGSYLRYRNQNQADLSCLQCWSYCVCWQSHCHVGKLRRILRQTQYALFKIWELSPYAIHQVSVCNIKVVIQSAASIWEVLASELQSMSQKLVYMLWGMLESRKGWIWGGLVKNFKFVWPFVQ